MIVHPNTKLIKIKNNDSIKDNNKQPSVTNSSIKISIKQRSVSTSSLKIRQKRNLLLFRNKSLDTQMLK